MHNNVQITDQLQNLLENSTKIDFEHLKNILEEIDITNFPKVVAREKKRAKIVSAGLSSILAVILGPLYLNRCVPAAAHLIAFRMSLERPWFFFELLNAFSIGGYFFGAFLLIFLTFWLQVKLRAKTLQKFAKY